MILCAVFQNFPQNLFRAPADVTFITWRGFIRRKRWSSRMSHNTKLIFVQIKIFPAIKINVFNCICWFVNSCFAAQLLSWLLAFHHLLLLLLHVNNWLTRVKKMSLLLLLMRTITQDLFRSIFIKVTSGLFITIEYLDFYFFYHKVEIKAWQFSL